MKTEIINLLQTTQALDGGNQGINARDQFTTEQLNTLKTLQSTNTALINLGMNYYERKGRLITLVERERHHS